MVHVRQVVERRKVDGEDADCRAADAQRGHDPRHRGRRGPAEPEQTHGHEDRFQADEVEAALGARGDQAEAAGELFLVDCEEYGDDGADADC